MSRTPSAEQQETVVGLLEAAKRPSGKVNVRTSFVQGGTQAAPVPGPMHAMLKAHDERAFDLFLLQRALVSAEPWTTRPLDARVWARAVGIDTDRDSGVTGISKAWRRLEVNYQLVQRSRAGRLTVLTSLLEDGCGKAYTSPNGSSRATTYLTIPFAYWTAPERWYASLDFSAKAMLLISLTLKPGFSLPTERAAAWYGVSTESADRGLRTLQKVGLLERTTTLKRTPLSPQMRSQEYHYTLLGDFSRTTKGRLALVPAITASA